MQNLKRNCQFKTHIRNLTNFDASTRKSKKFAQFGLLLTNAMLEFRKYGELCLIALKIRAKMEGKLACTSKNDMRNLADFHQST